MKERKEVSAELRRCVSECVTTLLGGGVVWTGSRTDLLELVRSAYVAGYVTETGRQPTYVALAEAVFRAVGERPVRNPYALARRASERKGVMGRSALERMRTVIELGASVEPLCKELIMRR